MFGPLKAFSGAVSGSKHRSSQGVWKTRDYVLGSFFSKETQGLFPLFFCKKNDRQMNSVIVCHKSSIKILVDEIPDCQGCFAVDKMGEKGWTLLLMVQKSGVHQMRLVV